MKKLFIGIALLFLIIIAAIIILPGLVPASTYKDKIETQLSSALERDVTIAGDVKLSVFPVLKAQTGSIQIDNAAGFTDTHFIKMDGLDARIRLLPLLSKKVEVSKFELTRPIINLEKKADGSVNWTIGDQSAAKSAADGEAEPFKRDGRFNDFDPKIGRFAITDGQVVYRDQVKDTVYNITDAGLSFSLPSLSEVVNVEGALTFNGTPINMDVSLDTPKHFLAGGIAGFDVAIVTDFAKIKGKGQFTESQDITFNANLDGSISDMKALTDLIPQSIAHSDLINSGQFAGDIVYDGQNIALTNSDLSAKGNLFDASFKGDAKVSLDSDAAPIAAGRITANVSDVAKLAAAFDQNIDGIELIDTARMSADLTAKEAGFLAKNIDAVLTGETLNAAYQGTADIGDDIKAAGRFTANAAALPEIVKALDLDIKQEIIVDEADISGKLTYTAEAIDVTFDKANVSGANLTANYVGTVSVRGEDISAQGDFTSDVTSAASLISALKIDAPQASILDKVKAAGRVDYTSNGISLNLSQAELSSSELNAAYQGDVNMIGDNVAVKGVVSLLDIPSAARLSQKIGLENDAAQLVGRVRLAQPLNIDYNGVDTRLDNVNISLSDGPMNGSFIGNVSHKSGTSGDMSLNGAFTGQAASLRNVAAKFGTTLPASTAQGAVFENLSTSGRLEGNLNQLNVSLDTLNIDRLNANGSFIVNMAGSKPSVTGRLSLPELDARPYQAAYAPPVTQPAPTGWSKTTINVDAIKKFNADVTLSTGSLVTSSVSFGQADIQAKIQNSRMTIDFPNMSLYSGRGSVNMVVDAAGRSPVLDMDVEMKSLDTESFLSKFASFASATGAGGTSFEVRGAGLSMDSIMKSLTGDGDFGVSDGSVKGVDMVGLLNGFSSGLNLQSALSGVGPTKVTEFSDLLGQFSMRNGVMTINEFDFTALGLAAKGGGTVDIGNRTVDFSFTPRLTAANANAFARQGIPLRISGDFASVKPGLDQGAVSSLLAAQAQSLIREQISNQVGGSAGSILGSVLGGSNSGSSLGATSPDIGSVIGGVLGGGQSSSSPQTPSAGSVLGGLLGGSSQSTTPTTANDNAKAEPKPEDIARDVLGGFFGKKKK